MSEQNYEIQRCGLSKDCAKLSRDFFHISSALESLQQENAKLKEQLAEITRGGLVKIADLPFEVKISSSIYIGEPMMFLPPKDFSALEKHIKEKRITIESAGE
jgi:hypothetical protein